jgi:hypothetical protein
MPNLRFLDLRCGYPYGSLKYGPVHTPYSFPLLLSIMAAGWAHSRRSLSLSSQCLQGKWKCSCSTSRSPTTPRTPFLT